jgi:polyhydroxyalkanoate synthase
MELIQHVPQTDTVHEVPLLVCPPWINKYYLLDLSPCRSFIEWAVQRGHTVFAISYRNPDASMAEWRLDDYLLEGPRTALDVIEDITGSSEVNIAALCVGGTLTAMLMAWLAEAGEQRVRSATLLDTLLDFDSPGALGLFTDEAGVEALVEQMSSTGYLNAGAMTGTFDVLCANDLIWNYILRNWLLGEAPLALDILTWNADASPFPAPPTRSTCAPATSEPSRAPHPRAGRSAGPAGEGHRGHVSSSPRSMTTSSRGCPGSRRS